MIIAKLYDPAYSYNARDDEEQDDVDRARKNCLKELEAYNQLIKFQGEIVPRFYGKYVYRIISQDRNETRYVHVLLLEYFNGISLFDFAKAHQFTFPTATKQKIISQLLHMVNILHFHGVFHHDLNAGNFLINDSSAGPGGLAITDHRFRVCESGYPRHGTQTPVKMETF
jgi:serine/threonine protein kinase